MNVAEQGLEKFFKQVQIVIYIKSYDVRNIMVGLFLKLTVMFCARSKKSRNKLRSSQSYQQIFRYASQHS